MILFLTTSDTDILALSGAVDSLPEGLRDTQAVNPLSLIQDGQTFEKFLSDTLPKADLVLLRLLGGDKALGEDFGKLEAACRRLGKRAVWSFCCAK